MDAPIGKNALKVTNAAHRVGVEIDVSELGSRMEREAMRLITDLTQQGVTGKELADRVDAGLMSLSDRPIADAARGASSEAFNLGRNLSAQEAASKIGKVVRSEILDQNTCDYCRAVDGQTVEFSSDEYLRLMPPNGCEGRELCRGFYVYERAA